MYVSNHFWIIPISLSTIVGAQIDDKAPRRAQIRTSNPPGGKSSGLWWGQQVKVIAPAMVPWGHKFSVLQEGQACLDSAFYVKLP